MGDVIAIGLVVVAGLIAMVFTPAWFAWEVHQIANAPIPNPPVPPEARRGGDVIDVEARVVPEGALLLKEKA